MSKFKFLLISIVPFLAVSCTHINEQASQVLQSGLSTNNIAQANNKATKSKGNLKGWELAVTNVKSEGQTIKGEYMKYEAAEAWTVVSVTIKNTSGKRQRADEGVPYLYLSKLMDSNGNKYDVKEIERNYSIDLYDKPFSVGETRSFDLLFDAPQGIKAKQLSIDTLEGNAIHTIHIKL